jgi:Xaa-Pro aminopeptidase
VRGTIGGSAIKHGLGTVCLEDMVVVTENGCEQLSSVSRKTW